MKLTFLSILTLKCCAQLVIGLTVFVAACVIISGPFLTFHLTFFLSTNIKSPEKEKKKQKTQRGHIPHKATVFHVARLNKNK